MGELKRLQQLVIDFRDERDWKQFHNPKDSAISLLLEASELLEQFQWKNAEQIETHLKTKRKDVNDEVVDVLYWVLLIAYDLDIDLEKEFVRKMEHNKAKYPVEKAKGNNKKYTELE